MLYVVKFENSSFSTFVFLYNMIWILSLFSYRSIMKYDTSSLFSDLYRVQKLTRIKRAHVTTVMVKYAASFNS